MSTGNDFTHKTVFKFHFHISCDIRITLTRIQQVLIVSNIKELRYAVRQVQFAAAKGNSHSRNTQLLVGQQCVEEFQVFDVQQKWLPVCIQRYNAYLSFLDYYRTM